jgi:hypothetical protein
MFVLLYLGEYQYKDQVDVKRVTFLWHIQRKSFKINGVGLFLEKR